MAKYGYEIEDLDFDFGENQYDSTQEVMDVVQAFYRCRNDLGRIDMNYIVQKTGLSAERVKRELEGIYMYEDLNGEWVTIDQLRRGNVRKKLADAESVFLKTGRLEKTIRALKAMQPNDVFSDEIELSIAAAWIPTYFKKQFIMYITNMLNAPGLEYDEYHRKWKVIPGIIRDQFQNTIQYGTMRLCAWKIIEKTMNAVPLLSPEVLQTGMDGYPELEKQRLLQKAFVEWIRNTPEVEERLTQLYMEKNGYTVIHYDGDHIKPEGLNPNVVLYKQQKDVIERIVSSGTHTLIGHAVGAGKTYAFEIGVNELLRFGIVKKAMIVVPNNVFDATVKTYRYLYPQEDFLAIYPADFAPKYRAQALNKIASSTCRLVFMAYSSFDMITMSRQWHLDELEADIRACRNMHMNARNARLKKIYDSTLQKLSDKYLKLLEKDFGIEACWDELGIDCLAIDEGHNYKNVSLNYRLGGVVGLHSKGSKKADLLLDKVRHIESLSGRVIFASGTPVTNSLADIYVLQKYLQHKELEFLDIQDFSDWCAHFCKEESNFEVSVDQSYEITTRLSEFHNLPELSALFSNVCDYYLIDKSELDLPENVIEKQVVVECSELVKKYMVTLRERADLIHARKVSRKEDNLLKITVDGRMASIDMRLVDPEAVCDESTSKAAACAKEVFELYQTHPGKTQIIFCDMSTPKRTFNLYDDMKGRLVAKGVPEKEIAFIHDATTEKQRERLIRNFNDGIIRIMIGSTRKLGTGTNVQTNLLAIHHLDIPWKPADLMQRRGRIERQGNVNDTIYEFQYLMKGTFDAFSYQKLESKQKVIVNFFSGTLSGGHRSEEDIGDSALKYSEIKALTIGNPLIKERVELGNELERMQLSSRHRQQELYKIQNLMCELPEMISRSDKFAKLYGADNEAYQKHRETISNEDREAFGEDLQWALKENVQQDQERLFDWYRGFRIMLPKGMERDKPYIIVRKNGSYKVELQECTIRGYSMRIDRLLVELKEKERIHLSQAGAYREELKKAEKELSLGNDYVQAIIALEQKIQEVDKRLEEESLHGTEEN